MKKRGRRCLISLLLGLCLLMPSQMKVLAADAQEDSSSVQAVEEAMPDQENVTTKEKNQSDSTKQDTQSQINNQTQSESKREQQQKSQESGNASSENTQSDMAVNENTENSDIAVLTDSYPATGKITAKIYLRYSNAIPDNINQTFVVGEFGPSGNNTPYFTVTVDLDQLNKKPVKTYTTMNGRAKYIYYSIDSDATWNPGTPSDAAGRVKNATNLWEQAIFQAMSSADQKQFENVFGSNMFVGYVLKRENDGWHIDGILKKDPPVYVVELYDQNDQALFAISSNDQKLPGVTYADFKTKVEEALGGTNYQYVTEERDRIVLTYEKDGRTWQATITPKTDGADKDYAGIYHVDPANNKFSYRTVSKDTYYLSRMKIQTEDVTKADLSISKTVKGSVANPSEHFTFVLTASNLAGKTFNVTYTGTKGCSETHASQITFDRSGIARIILKNGESVKIQNIPSGDIRIKEESGNYWTYVAVNGADQEYDQENGITLNIDNANVTAEFTNQMEQQPVTGIFLTTFPYVLILCLVVTALVYGYVRRKRNV